MTRAASLACAAAAVFGGLGCVLAGRPPIFDGSNVTWAGVQHHGALPGSDGFGPPGPAATSFVQTRQKSRRMMSRDPEQLIAWTDSHQAISADGRFSADKLTKMGQSIDAKAFGNTLHGLCDQYQSRFVGTSGNSVIAQKIKGEFDKLGLQTWTEALGRTQEVDQYVQANASQNVGGNVIGFLKGTDLAHEVVLLGAHYDSVNWENKGGPSPGIDDNGSGSALVQLVAKTIVNSGVKPRRSLMFVAFNAEEEGLVGSEQMARQALRGDYGDLKAVLIADEVAYPGSGNGNRKAIFETVGDVPGTIPLVDTFAQNALHQHGDGINGFEVNLHGFGSDHIPFLRTNVPSLLLIERDNIAHSDKWGHSVRDSYDHVDFGYGAAMSRLMLRATAALSSPAGAPSKVAGLKVARRTL